MHTCTKYFCIVVETCREEFRFQFKVFHQFGIRKFTISRCVIGCGFPVQGSLYGPARQVLTMIRFIQSFRNKSTRMKHWNISELRSVFDTVDESYVMSYINYEYASRVTCIILQLCIRRIRAATYSFRAELVCTSHGSSRPTGRRDELTLHCFLLMITHPHFHFNPVVVWGGMRCYHHIINVEKLRSSKKLSSFLQRCWKGVIPIESGSLAASGANCRYR